MLLEIVEGGLDGTRYGVGACENVTNDSSVFPADDWRMTAAPDLHQLAGGDFIWQAFDPSVKADLFSTALASEAGVYLIDPIPIASETLTEALAGRPVLGVIVTNANHWRASRSFIHLSGGVVYAHPNARFEAPDTAVVDTTSGAATLAGLEIIALPGAAEGEIALRREDDCGGTVVVGDAVINSGSYGFSLLPQKYCTDAKLLKKSLGRLLEYRFERILFAHGTPILTDGRAKLASLLQ